MYTVESRYITKDGKEHKTAKHAELHVEAVVKDKILEIIKLSVLSKDSLFMTQSDMILLAEVMYAARGTLAEALSYEAFGEDD